MLRLVCVLIVMAIPALLTAGDDDVRKELKALQGTWKAVALEAVSPQSNLEDCSVRVSLT
ncbi:MAG: hypothetical protein FJ303_27430 [Planctomycetes bacterium]|nr:hypothetical protein [Planctomycetota bacterium]